MEYSELAGGIKNALERGEHETKVKQSFLNAGYTQEEVEKAFSQINPQNIQPTQSPKQSTPQKDSPTKTSDKKEKKPGFFSRIFKKKKKSPEEEKSNLQKEEKKPEQEPPAPQNNSTNISPKEEIKTASLQRPESMPKSSALVKATPAGPTQVVQKKFPRWLIITLIIASAVLIIGAAILGLLWRQLFG